MGRYATAHANPNGPGDARPTALQIVKDEAMLGALNGKNIFITGAASGIGIETARALYATGAHLYFGIRDLEKGKEVAKDIAGADVKERIDLIHLDLGSLESVRAAAKDFYSKTSTLNILINNAGVMAAPKDMKTQDGFDVQFGTNHLGHHLLFQLLKPALLKASTPSFNSRVVCLSSTRHRDSPIRFDDLNFEKEPYQKWVAYGQSKTANIYLANEIERRYGDQGLHATSLHPGGIFTRLARHMDEADMSDIPEGIEKVIKSPEQGAATTVWAAIGKDWEGKGGKYLEECSVSEPIDPKKGEVGVMDPGYKNYIYDVEAGKRLWEVSNKLVAFQE